VLGLGTALFASRALAQAAPLADGVRIGAWTFRPSLELRVRGEYTHAPIDQGGVRFASSAVLEDGYRVATPPVAGLAQTTSDAWLVGERARLGLAVDRGPVTGVLSIQDARALGQTDAALAPGPAAPALPSFAPFEAYVDVHTTSGRRMFLRVGRQRVAWGRGRLVGENDWRLTARSLDALRFGVQSGDVDVEAFAALLAAPGSMPPEATGDRAPAGGGTGTELYGLDAVWHFHPLLQGELTGLARVARDPVPTTFVPSNTFVIDGRLFGSRRGFEWDLEGAYELGRVRSFGENRELRAFALAGHAELETSLPHHLTFGALGAYASGGDDAATDQHGTLRRFDPILPDERTTLSPMGLYAWSNVVEGGGYVGARPTESLTLRAGYRFAALASPTDRWTTSALVPVGAAPSNGARTLGHEIDATLGWEPWDGLRVSGGYGLFLFGSGADAILASSRRDAGSVQHWAFLQTTLRAP
jgi:hypothetical protein